MATTKQQDADKGFEFGENPVALVAGGMAVGVLIGMLLPRLDKEKALLEPIGGQLADRAHAAIDAAKQAAKAEVESLIPGRDMAKDRASALFGSVVDAAKGGATKRDVTQNT